ncbi:DUF7619 domain-containing protein [Psychroserpens mesophilus]|uniref:T9SS type A sorting domain-containing protein n=1 Tax=Psychroserpens mesophilus TaxID=325473 RepID=UPI003D6476FB
MKNYYTLLVAFLFSLITNAQIVNIPDPILKNRLLNGYCVDLDGDGNGDTDVDTNNDNEIQVSEAEAVLSLDLDCNNSSCMFSSFVGLEAFTNLQNLSARNNNLTTLDLSALTNLETLDCSSNDITSITFGSLQSLNYLKCSANQLDSIDVSSLFNLETFICNSNQLNSINFGSISNLTHFDCRLNQLSSIELDGFTNLSYFLCSDNQLNAIDASQLTNLTTLSCSNNQLSSLDVSNSTNLTELDCSSNQLNNLNLGVISDLFRLTCDNNQLSTIDLTSLTNLTILSCDDNQITSLDFSNTGSLETLDCSNNLLLDLDVSEASNLNSLTCNNNPNLSSIQLGSSIIWLTVEYSGLTEVDFSETSIRILNLKNNENLTHVKLGIYNQDDFYIYNVEDNPILETISFKNGDDNFSDNSGSSDINICNNTSLAFVCADEFEMDNVQDLVNNCGYTNVTVNSYCSFTPGGEYYLVEGDVTLDVNNDGCDASDIDFPNLNFSITNGSEIGNFISNISGSYGIPLTNGSYSINPTLENPSYFLVSPSSLTVDFPSDTSPYIQDFCITPNGTYNDLEITLFPIDEARPGFDAYYKIVYKNKGTTTLSGTIDLTFQDDLMDLISASPSEDSQSGNMLSWNFTDLTPFESRNIFFTMNINSPSETPPVNGDDVLVFDASVNSSETDETPDDNTFQLNQTVVNSFDPNDKTCLEGDVISPEMVGDYVHYMIRFENTGTANAVNIVVKDDIDTSKYDLASLIPLHASHNYIARIKDNALDHYVEFIFENINLPFDDANNDGYIVFKIKTLDTLGLGDTFENDAEIYFDFNFPIVTNNEQTTVATLSTEEFELANNNITLYPNPTTNVLHLESKQNIKQIGLYDISGRQIQDIAVIGLKTNIDISTETLSTGTYFMKIKTETSTLVKKFIKE